MTDRMNGIARLLPSRLQRKRISSISMKFAYYFTVIMPTENHYLFSNQVVMPKHISTLLSSLIGPIEGGGHKIGKSWFYVLYGYCDAKENLKTGW